MAKLPAWWLHAGPYGPAPEKTMTINEAIERLAALSLDELVERLAAAGVDMVAFSQALNRHLRKETILPIEDLRT